jgi:hypothetical protein
MTQPLMQDKLLTLLKEGWVTPVSALEQAQCFSLSQRVGEFSRQGWNVIKEWVDLPSGKRVKRYHIDGKANA